MAPYDLLRVCDKQRFKCELVSLICVVSREIAEVYSKHCKFLHGIRVAGSTRC